MTEEPMTQETIEMFTKASQHLELMAKAAEVTNTEASINAAGMGVLIVAVGQALCLELAALRLAQERSNQIAQARYDHEYTR